MRYFYEKQEIYTHMYGQTYICDHPIYDRCTLYKLDDKGLAVIQQRYDQETKHTYWTEIDPWLIDPIYVNPKYIQFFKKYSDISHDGLYPTVSVRQIMWALRMKPLPKESWETCFDKKAF